MLLYQMVWSRKPLFSALNFYQPNQKNKSIATYYDINQALEEKYLNQWAFFSIFFMTPLKNRK